MDYTSICVTKSTRERVRQLADAERRALSEVVALAVEARFNARTKAIAATRKTGEVSADA